METKVLVMTGCYIPGVKGGGPIQSIKNMVENLSNVIDFYIVTSDRDLGDINPYPNIEVDEWVRVGEAKVFYTDVSKLNFIKIKKIVNSINYDVMYLNSFFSNKFSITPILLTKLKQITKKPIVLAPRGEFSKGALSLKSKKKNFFIKIVKLLNLYSNVTWHATAETEKKDIQEVLEENENIIIANNLTANYKELTYDKNIEKKPNELKIAFISRIHPKKNLITAIKLLRNTKGTIKFNIFGPIEDNTYWSECLKEIEKLPEMVEVIYKGTLEHEKVIEVFKAHHIFLFPTLGENFGHVISEALIGGCPVITSDQTPWRNMSKYGAGYDINLQNEKEFINSVQEYINMGNSEYQKISRNAFNLGKKLLANDEDINKSIELFQKQ